MNAKSNICIKNIVPICGGLEGEIGSLNEDENWKDDEVSIPIDNLIVDLTRNGLEVDEIGQAMDV